MPEKFHTTKTKKKKKTQKKAWWQDGSIGMRRPDEWNDPNQSLELPQPQSTATHAIMHWSLTMTPSHPTTSASKPQKHVSLQCFHATNGSHNSSLSLYDRPVFWVNPFPSFLPVTPVLTTPNHLFLLFHPLIPNISSSQAHKLTMHRTMSHSQENYNMCDVLSSVSSVTEYNRSDLRVTIGLQRSRHRHQTCMNEDVTDYSAHGKISSSSSPFAADILPSH